MTNLTVDTNHADYSPRITPVGLMSKNKEDSLSKILSLELQKRRERNPRYSIRSFARDLNLSPRALTDAINSKRQLSQENLHRVATRLCMPNLELMPTRIQKPTYYKLSESEEKEMVGNWYYTAVFSLARMKNNRSAPEWISRRLGITETQAKRAVNCLCHIGLIEVRAGRMLLLKSNFETMTDIPSEVIRHVHRQNLKRAQESLERDPVKSRDITSITLSFAEKDMNRAKEYIWKICQKFSKKFDNMNGTDVYTLAIQFFPQTVLSSKGVAGATERDEKQSGGHSEFKESTK